MVTLVTGMASVKALVKVLVMEKDSGKEKARVKDLH